MASDFLKEFKLINVDNNITPNETLVFQSYYWSVLVKYDFRKELLQEYFESITKSDRVQFFKFAIDCISCFVQTNFTGPDVSTCHEEFFSKEFSHLSNFQKLSINNDDMNVNIRYAILLYTAKCIFKNCVIDEIVNTWWQWRAILIHQQVLDSLSPILLSEANDVNERMQDFQFDEEEITAELEIEQAQLYNLYRQIIKAEYHLNIARNLLHVEYELIGKMGKRTKFQQTDIAQLALSIKTKERCKIVLNELEVPNNVALEDDVVLDNIEFTDPEVAVPNLSTVEQKLLLTSLQLMVISQPQDNLYYEEVKPFINILLRQNNTWVLRTVLLLIRSKFEAKHKRTVERCLMQCEEIINAINKDTPHSCFRVFDVYGTGIQPIWKTKELFGNLMLSLGLVKGALDIFLPLQNWEAVITCYTLLKLRHKAAEVIQQQLSIKPTVKLWCSLGDATDDISCYEKAWKLSNESSFVAQYHWGLFYYHRRQYEECISHLQKSVDLNPLQPPAWLYLGYAALETEHWESAAVAYRHYTSLEPGSFETWNNLAKAYIKIGNKRGAHQALQDALKCNYDNWKVWDNLMGVSADIGHFSDIIRSYHRILELKEKHLDIEVLTVLVRGVCSDIRDSDGNPVSRLLQKTRELFGRITAVYPSDGHVWELYSKLSPDQFIKVQRLQRSLKGFMKPDWEKNQDQCLQVLFVCKNLAEEVLSDEIDPKNSILNSIKLNLKSVMSVVKKQDYKETCELLRQVDELLQKLLKKIQSA